MHPLPEQTFRTRGTHIRSLYAARLHPCMATLPVDDGLTGAAIRCTELKNLLGRPILTWGNLA